MHLRVTQCWDHILFCIYCKLDSCVAWFEVSSLITCGVLYQDIDFKQSHTIVAKVHSTDGQTPRDVCKISMLLVVGFIFFFSLCVCVCCCCCCCCCCFLCVFCFFDCSYCFVRFLFVCVFACCFLLVLLFWCWFLLFCLLFCLFTFIGCC